MSSKIGIGKLYWSKNLLNPPKMNIMLSIVPYSTVYKYKNHLKKWLKKKPFMLRNDVGYQARTQTFENGDYGSPSGIKPHLFCKPHPFNNRPCPFQTLIFSK